MRSYWLKTSVIIITLLLAACGGASTSVVPSTTPTIQPTDAPTSTSEAVTAISEQATESVPTPAAAATPAYDYYPATPATEPPSSTDVTVLIEDFAFVPREIRIKAGTTVTWENVASRQHSATGVDGTFDTGLFDPDDVRSFTFEQPGTYPYFCQIHGSVDGLSGMIGVVVVDP